MMVGISPIANTSGLMESWAMGLVQVLSPFWASLLGELAKWPFYTNTTSLELQNASVATFSGHPVDQGQPPE